MMIPRIPGSRNSAADRLALLAALALGLAGAASASGLSTDSPFLPQPAQGAVGQVASGTIELAGIGEIDGKTWICLYDSTKKKGHWFAVGTTTDGVQVVSCNPEGNQAVIRAGGETLTLALRKPSHPKTAGTVASINLPPPIQQPAPSAPQPLPGIGGPGAPQAQSAMTKADQEREARMLVADLMEIGMRQRKAYEEAQKKAAAEAEQKRAEALRK